MTPDLQNLRGHLDQLAKRAGHSSVLAEILAGQVARQERDITEARELFRQATFEDGWYQVERKGEREDPATGNILVIDDESIRSIVDNFNSHIVPGFRGMPVKYPGPSGLVTPPAGRAMRLEARKDGVWAFIVWDKAPNSSQPKLSINI
ncbi:MAG TPA: hypothetical protein VFE51_20090 [Verrucomicrobiae bacterium]|nr:hypothetical protein [Verrucomicrobiae bacterium]